jgi:CRP-like cAMP-binding protein
MLLKQSDLFRGLSHALMEKIMAEASKETHPAGTRLFSKGDRANRFYTLVKGSVKLTVGEEGNMVFSINRAGECFGWSALVGRERYTATAECTGSTTLVEFDGERLTTVMEDFPADGYRFMKQLAAMLGQRLIQSYQAILSFQASQTTPTAGTGQRLEPEAAF